jgi:hypothetical protein
VSDTECKARNGEVPQKRSAEKENLCRARWIRLWRMVPKKGESSTKKANGKTE